MSKVKEPKSKRLNKCAVDGKYKIERFVKGVVTVEEVEADEIAYDVFGLRPEGKLITLDHIPTGWRVAQFRTHNACLNAVKELLAISDFKWHKMPDNVRVEGKEVLKRWAV